MKALVLAGGFPQIALIEELKSRGIYTILADYYEEPVAKKYADKFYQASTLDVDAIMNIAKDEEVDFLITACTDQALLTVAYVSEKLNLPCYIDYKTALNVTNKSYMKSVFYEHDINTAKYAVMTDFNEERISKMSFPLIVKPVDCNSSKGVKKVFDEEELIEAFNKAKQYSRTNNVIVEEFIDGEELSVDVYVENGKANVLSISTSDKIKDKDKFVIFRGVYSEKKYQETYVLVETVAQKIADAFHLVDSPMLIQMIYDGKDVHVLEFSARTGGGVKYLLIKKVSGFDVISAVVDLTLGIKPTVNKTPAENKYIVNEFIYCKPGVFDTLNGFEELKEKSIISDYYLFKWKNSVFDTIENSGDRVAGFTVQDDDIDKLNEKRNLAISNMKVLDVEGNDMMRKDLFSDIKEDDVCR